MSRYAAPISRRCSTFSISAMPPPLPASAPSPTAVGSAFTFAFAAPNLFRRLFGEGALSAAFVPQYATLSKDNPRAAALLSLRTVRWLAITTTVLAVVIAMGSLAVLLIAPGDPERTLSLRLLAVMILYMPLVCLTAYTARTTPLTT